MIGGLKGFQAVFASIKSVFIEAAQMILLQSELCRLEGRHIPTPETREPSEAIIIFHLLLYRIVKQYQQNFEMVCNIPSDDRCARVAEVILDHLSLVTVILALRGVELINSWFRRLSCMKFGRHARDKDYKDALDAPMLLKWAILLWIIRVHGRLLCQIVWFILKIINRIIRFGSRTAFTIMWRLLNFGIMGFIPSSTISHDSPDDADWSAADDAGIADDESKAGNNGGHSTEEDEQHSSLAVAVAEAAAARTHWAGDEAVEQHLSIKGAEISPAK